MIDCLDWFLNFAPIPHGEWSVAVADDRDLWVLGTWNINIHGTIDGIQNDEILCNVLYISNLHQNLFSIGLASKMVFLLLPLETTMNSITILARGQKSCKGNWLLFYTNWIFNLSLPLFLPQLLQCHPSTYILEYYHVHKQSP